MGLLSRRELLASFAGAAASRTADGSHRPLTDENTRSEIARQIRLEAARFQSEHWQASAVANGDESFARHIAVFTKGLPHDQYGEVEDAAYQTLLQAIATGKHEDFERISRGSGRRFVSPQAAYAFQLEGGDSHRFACPAPPGFTSAEAAAEMRELYWQALCRDIPFAAYSESEQIRYVAEDLQKSPRTVFRGSGQGELDGPYLSQFLAKPIPMGSTLLEQRYRTPQAGTNFLDGYGEWLQIQTGVPPWREAVWDPVPRYIRNGRDLAEWVHYDFLYQAFLNAALIIIDSRPETLLSDRRFVLQRSNPYRHSDVQDGFVTFGFAEVVDWLGRVTTAALKAAWAQKWLVHHRLRPEEFGGRVHHARLKTSTYPIHEDLLGSPAVDLIYSQTGTFLLPQAYPEGAPLHPAYPSGHATVAGACSVVLKALFDETALIPNCVHASADGVSLMPCPPSFAPTIGAEVNKLAFNIAVGRNWAGIHYRSDALGGIQLGEEVGISILQDLVRCCSETFDGFEFTRYNGTRVRIDRSGELS